MIRPLLAALALLGSLLTAPHAAAATACSTPSDFDGDGLDDVAIGDPFSGGGTVHLLSAGRTVAMTAPARQAGDGFGWSVTLAKVDGDACADVVVGAPFTDVDGLSDAGAVYVLYGGGAKPPRRIVSPRPQRDAHLGWSLAARGDLLAVGAPYEDAPLHDAGAVYVAKGEGALRGISAESPGVQGNGEVDDLFGWSLTFAGGRRLVVGVPYENDDGAGRQVGTGQVDSGSVVVLDDVLAPTLTSVKWDAPGEKADGHRYGFAVAYADGAGLAVSAPQARYVHLFDADLKAVRIARFEQGDGPAGVSLAVSADGRVAVGLPYAGQERTGAVQVISIPAGGQDRRIAPDRQPGARFGWSLAFTGNRVVAGSPDAGNTGTITTVGRNESTVVPISPGEGLDFGTSMAG
ncbi:hypothetical protein [Nonomuraea sp. NPDC046570]|uniref:hypothetical protein n=1 Tax=Nonomuraea sp. NPDC046570 TaxID=3155255 RepID=UPI003407733C